MAQAFVFSWREGPASSPTRYRGSRAVPCPLMFPGDTADRVARLVIRLGARSAGLEEASFRQLVRETGSVRLSGDAEEVCRWAGVLEAFDPDRPII